MDLQVLTRYLEDGLLYKQTHPTLPLTIWNYTEKVQYEGLWDEVTLSCRGLVTDDKGIVVARPFKKFFNIEEGKHIPTSSFDVYEKMDGSLIIVFWYDGGWVVASRGSFTSEQAVAASKIFFDKLDHNFSIGITYLFEFTAKWNRIVVDYGDEDNLTLLGAIRTDDETEATYEQLEMIARGANCDVVKRYDGFKDYSTLKGIIKDNQEGFVVRFSNGDRMKIKGEEYLRLHKVMTNLSTTAVWEVLSSGGSVDELLKDVPDEFYNKIKEYEQELSFQFNMIFSDYFVHFRSIQNKIGDVAGNRAEFASHAKNYQYPSILFAMLDGKDIAPIISKIIKPEFRKL
jgi:RNA ligase